MPTRAKQFRPSWKDGVRVSSVKGNPIRYGREWYKRTDSFRKKNPLCVMCLDKGRIEPMSDVDHIVPHRGDRGLFWDQSNWQALCHSCHSRKTVKEDGGFGNGTIDR